MPEPEPRILHETFADRHGQPVGRDDPAVATIEVELQHADGRVERIYAEVGSSDERAVD
jgi:hypothetical protein